jgi:hypothetical protein
MLSGREKENAAGRQLVSEVKGAADYSQSRHPADNLTRHLIDALKKSRGKR